LRGKYSGNCLSCTAKWSKCWYIASIDNQSEWEERLRTMVTPGDDEVCFQCWDAKIRTSPKRKMLFKAVPENSDGVSGTRAKRTPISRKVMRDELASDATTYKHSDPSSIFNRGYSGSIDSGSECESMSSFYEGGVIFEEENAVILLSTAFRTINPHISDVNININITSYGITDFGDSGDERSRKRGSYCCSKCGKPKKGHVCDIPSPDQSIPSLPIQSLIQVSAATSLSHSTQIAPAVPPAFAQPVVS